MRILISVDTHGKVPNFEKNVDLILIGGDFAKGDALRKMIFEGGSQENVKKELLESTTSFFDRLIKFGKQRILWGSDAPWCDNLIERGYEEEVTVSRKMQELGLTSKLF